MEFGVIGFGYWGPNIVRNIVNLDGSRVRAIADASPSAQARARKDELDELMRARGGEVHYVIGRRGTEIHMYPLAAKYLRTVAPDVRERDVFICGPREMIEGVDESLAALGVPADQIHRERFAFL